MLALNAQYAAICGLVSQLGHSNVEGRPYPKGTRHLAALRHLVDGIHCLHCRRDTLSYALFNELRLGLETIFSMHLAKAASRKVVEQERPMNEHNGMPICQVQNVSLALDDRSEHRSIKALGVEERAQSRPPFLESGRETVGQF